MPIAEHREVRVTPRVSIKAPFVAHMDVAGLSTHQRELMKGERDWTDFEAKVQSNADDRHARKVAARQLADMNAGTPIRRAVPDKGRVMNATGPSAEYRAMLAAAKARKGKRSR